jgi:hypothetical protein
MHSERRKKEESGRRKARRAIPPLIKSVEGWQESLPPPHTVSRARAGGGKLYAGDSLESMADTGPYARYSLRPRRAPWSLGSRAAVARTAQEHHRQSTWAERHRQAMERLKQSTSMCVYGVCSVDSVLRLKAFIRSKWSVLIQVCTLGTGYARISVCTGCRRALVLGASSSSGQEPPSGCSFSCIVSDTCAAHTSGLCQGWFTLSLRASASP